MKRLRSAHEESDGAIAIIVAIFAVVLMVLTAFAVDVGNAYANARQLSVAVDADALAAAAAVGESIPPGQACTQALLDSLKDSKGNTGAVAIATAVANALNSANASQSEPVEGVTVKCAKADPSDSTNNAVEVRVNNRRAVKTYFAGLIGVNEIRPNSYAVAQYFRSRTAGGLRPWAVCDTTVKEAQKNQTTTYWTAIDNLAGPCGTAASGDWGAVDFDGGSNNAVDLAKWTNDGYPGYVKIPSVIPADPGVSNKSELRSAFEALIGKVVLFPSVTGFTPETGNNPSGGSNASFPTVGIATLRVCGIKYGNNIYTLDQETKATSDCWVQPVAPSTTTTDNSTTDNSGTVDVDMAKNSRDLTIDLALFPAPPVDQAIKVAVTIPGAGPGGSALTTPVATYSSTTKVTLTDKVSSAVPKGTPVTITTTTTTSSISSGGVPLPQPGPFELQGNTLRELDYIQFRWVNYSTSDYPGSNQKPCDFTDQLCVGATRLWR